MLSCDILYDDYDDVDLTNQTNSYNNYRDTIQNFEKDTIKPNSNTGQSEKLTLKDSYYPKELEEYFEVARKSNKSSAHYLKLRNVSASDYDRISKIINQNDDFYIHLTISSYNYVPSNALCGSFSNKSIYSITLENVTAIRSAAFKNLKSLKEVNIKSSIKEIGKNAFQNCSHLEKVYLNCPPPKLDGNNCFPSNSSLKIYVSHSYYDRYLEADFWKDLNIVRN